MRPRKTVYLLLAVLLVFMLIMGQVEAKDNPIENLSEPTDQRLKSHPRVEAALQKRVNAARA